jgi:hypothetical protein
VPAHRPGPGDKEMTPIDRKARQLRRSVQSVATTWSFVRIGAPSSTLGRSRQSGLEKTRAQLPPFMPTTPLTIRQDVIE